MQSVSHEGLLDKDKALLSSEYRPPSPIILSITGVVIKWWQQEHRSRTLQLSQQDLADLTDISADFQR